MYKVLKTFLKVFRNDVLISFVSLKIEKSKSFQSRVETFDKPFEQQWRYALSSATTHQIFYNGNQCLFLKVSLCFWRGGKLWMSKPSFSNIGANFVAFFLISSGVKGIQLEREFWWITLEEFIILQSKTRLLTTTLFSDIVP